LTAEANMKFIFQVLKFTNEESYAISVLEVRGQEALSQCYRYEIELLVIGPELKAADLIGRDALLNVVSSQNKVIKMIHGIITSLSFSVRVHDRQRIIVTLEPALARLEKSFNSRVFQDKSLLQIVNTVLAGHGITPGYVTNKSLDNLPTKSFSFQFNESDLHFINRTLQEFGYFYFFKHSPAKHTMCLHNDSTQISSHNPTLSYKPMTKLVADQDLIYEKQTDYRGEPGSLLACSYRFSEFNWNIRRPASANVGSHVAFLHAGVELSRFNLEKWSNARYSEWRANSRLVTMLTTSRELAAGDTFVLSHSGTEIEQYLIVEVDLHCSQPGEAKQHASAISANYKCRLVCTVKDDRYAPNGLFTKPLIPNVLTAVVVAPDSIAESDFAPHGEKRVDSRFDRGDAYCDSNGRVLIQFTWQSLNQQSAKFWARISYPSAGPGRGFQFVPRIGDTVLVSFINGDPDSPIVLGSVYGQNAYFPHALPEHRNHTLIRGRPNNERCNEICLDDTPQRGRVSIVNVAGHRIELDEVGACVVLKSASGHKIKLSDSEKYLTICSDQGHRIQLQDGRKDQASHLIIESNSGHTVRMDDSNNALHLKSRGGQTLRLDDDQQSIELRSVNNQKISIDDAKKNIEIKSNSGLMVRLDDDQGLITLGNRSQQVELVLDADQSNIRLASSGDLEILAPDGNITINARNINLTSTENIKLNSQSDLQVNAGNSLRLESANFNSETEGECTLKAQLIKLN